MDGYLIEYGCVDETEGGAVEPGNGVDVRYFQFDEDAGTYVEDTSATPTPTPTSIREPSATQEEPTPTAEQTPSPTAADTQMSLDEIISALELSLSAGFEDNYTLKTDGNTISATVWADGVSLNATMATLGNAENLEVWNDLVDNTLSTAESWQSILNDNGHADVAFIMQVANDLNEDHDTVLLSVSLGVVLYDYVNGINLLGG